MAVVTECGRPPRLSAGRWWPAVHSPGFGSGRVGDTSTPERRRTRSHSRSNSATRQHTSNRMPGAGCLCLRMAAGGWLAVDRTGQYLGCSVVASQAVAAVRTRPGRRPMAQRPVRPDTRHTERATLGGRSRLTRGWRMACGVAEGGDRRTACCAASVPVVSMLGGTVGGSWPPERQFRRLGGCPAVRDRARGERRDA